MKTRNTLTIFSSVFFPLDLFEKPKSHTVLTYIFCAITYETQILVLFLISMKTKLIIITFHLYSTQVVLNDNKSIIFVIIFISSKKMFCLLMSSND